MSFHLFHRAGSLIATSDQQKRLRTKSALKPWITNDLKELSAERDYAFKIAKRSGGQQWDNYRKLKNFTNRMIKAAEAEYYKSLIKSAVGPREMWHSLNLVLGAKKEEGSAFQVQVLFFTASEPIELQGALGREYSLISKWYTDNRLTLNVKKTKLMLVGSKTMLSKFENFESLPDGGQINRVKSFKYLGVTVDEKWSWKCHIKTLLRKLGHRLSVFNWISHMLDRRTRMAYFNGLVLPHCDYADIVWGDQPGLESEMERLQAFPNRFAKKIDGSKQSSAEAMAVHSM